MYYDLYTPLWPSECTNCLCVCVCVSSASLYTHTSLALTEDVYVICEVLIVRFKVEGVEEGVIEHLAIRCTEDGKYCISGQVRALTKTILLCAYLSTNVIYNLHTQSISNKHCVALE